MRIYNLEKYGRVWEIDHKKPIASSVYENRSSGAIFGNRRRK